MRSRRGGGKIGERAQSFQAHVRGGLCVGCVRGCGGSGSLSGSRINRLTRREVISRTRMAIPLRGNGYATHVLALQASAGVASGPGADHLQYRVGGAWGQAESVTCMEMFGGSFITYPVRGYDPSARFGRYACRASAEYGPRWGSSITGLARGPLYLYRAMAYVFFHTCNAWAMAVPQERQNAKRSTLASPRAEITTEILVLCDMGLRLRTGLAVPLVEGNGVLVYTKRRSPLLMPCKTVYGPLVDGGADTEYKPNLVPVFAESHTAPKYDLDPKILRPYNAFARHLVGLGQFSTGKSPARAVPRCFSTRRSDFCTCLST